MGWWILLGILVLLLILPLGVSVLYDSGGARVLVLVGPLRFTVFPVKRKEKKAEKQAAKEQPQTETDASSKEVAKKTPLQIPEPPKPPEEPKEQKQEPAGGSLTDFLPLVELALRFVGEFFGKTLHIDVLYLKLTMAGDDPADLAINYGKAWAALGALWPKIDDLLTIKKRDIRLQCDFEASEMLVNARVDITLTLARLLGLVISYGVRIAWRFFKIMDKRKKAAAQAQPEQINK